MKEIRKYELYAHDPYDVSDIGRGYTKQGVQPWKLHVRARSTREAYWLIWNQVVSSDGEEVGIVGIGHSGGPAMLETWPFSFDISEVRNDWGLKE